MKVLSFKKFDKGPRMLMLFRYYDKPFWCYVVELNFKEHMSTADLTINLTKSKFCHNELKYFDYMVGGCKAEADKSKNESIQTMNQPKDAKEV